MTSTATDEPLSWDSVGKLSVGRWGEWYAAMALTRRGVDIYAPFVDHRGVDLVARIEEEGKSRYIELQVKTARLVTSRRANTPYIFFRKKYFRPAGDLYAVLVVLTEGRTEPDMFLVPSLAWATPDAVFVSRDYEGLKSEPEFGISLNAATIARLEQHRLLSRPTFASPGAPD